jgi:hypothetical protein
MEHGVQAIDVDCITIAVSLSSAIHPHLWLVSTFINMNCHDHARNMSFSSPEEPVASRDPLQPHTSKSYLTEYSSLTREPLVLKCLPRHEQSMRLDQLIIVLPILNH